MSKYQVGDSFEIHTFNGSENTFISSVRGVMDYTDGVFYCFRGPASELMWITEEYLDDREKIQ